jgi:putative NIF3 family GTP cyclohydrolase 1 type 2
MTISITISRRMLVFAVAATLFASGAAWVFAQRETPDYVFACIKDDSVRLVVNATDCKDNETGFGMPTEAKILALEAQIADLQAADIEMDATLRAEANDRAGADALLQSNIDVEATARQAGDTELQRNVYAALANETSTRQQADATLQGNIDTEANARQITDAELQRNVAAVQDYAEAVQATAIDALTSASGIEDLLYHFSRDGNDVYITGANLHVVNGMNATSTTNSLGNIIVGYNELGSGGVNYRSGSHMLIVGPQHSYNSYGGIVVGADNTVTGPYASVSGGVSNSASGVGASVTGGWVNSASGDQASVSGGSFNRASGDRASVSGGLNRTAEGLHNWTAGNLFQEE